jgi:hypothetical protein
MLHPKTPIPAPCAEQVKAYLESWNGNTVFKEQEDFLHHLFHTVYPRNVDLNEILAKVYALNTAYATQVYYPVHVAHRILDLKIDQRLLDGDPTLVNDLQTVSIDDAKTYHYYSFSTKYCSHHNPEYPLFDQFVEKVLIWFRDNGSTPSFQTNDLRDYPSFKRAILNFRSTFALECFTIKELDIYLWQMGKRHFGFDGNR